MNTSHKLQYFDGLRGIAAFVVLLSHLHLGFYPNAYTDLRLHFGDLPRPLSGVLIAAIEGMYNGTFAVWLFWIMSAFVLALQFFLRTNEGDGKGAHDYLEAAVLRRYPRLVLPILASVLFAFVILSVGGMHNLALENALGESYKSDWLSGFYTFAPNFPGAVKSALWDSVFAYETSSSYNTSLWSMQAEWEGSLFLFAFLGLFGQRSSRLFAYPLVALSLLIYHKYSLNAFVVGIALCDFYVNRSKTIPSRRSAYTASLYFASRSTWLAASVWILIIIAVGSLGNHDSLFLLMAFVAVAWTLTSRPTQAVLSNAIPVFLGKISFGLYLVHLPIICSFSCWVYMPIARRIGGNAAALLTSALTCTLAIGVAYSFYRAVDRPSTDVSRRLSSFILKKMAARKPGSIKSAFAACSSPHS